MRTPLAVRAPRNGPRRTRRLARRARSCDGHWRRTTRATLLRKNYAGRSLGAPTRLDPEPGDTTRPSPHGAYGPSRCSERPWLGSRMQLYPAPHRNTNFRIGITGNSPSIPTRIVDNPVTHARTHHPATDFGAPRTTRS